MVLVVALACGAAGGLVIGVRKRRPVLGFILGLALSWIGWIVIALVPRRGDGAPFGTRLPVNARGDTGGSVLDPSGTPCATCGTVLASDTTYCTRCGNPRGAGPS